MWHLGNLVQETISSPCSLSLPLANSPRHKESLIAAFKRLYKSFPAHLTNLDYLTLQHQVPATPRAVRQNLFLTSNYHHCLMLLQASENDAGGVERNVRAALESAHEAIWAFFKLWAFFETEAAVWWVFQHRAFEESLLIAHLLSLLPGESLLRRRGSTASSTGSQGRFSGSGSGSEATTLEPLYAKAKDDVQRMLEIMERYGGGMEMHRTKKEALREALGRIAL
jgi:hypothetical protein